jgi:hypothetical protein
MTTAPTRQRPTHRIYAVTGKNDKNEGRWTEIGAAWAHKDGKGFNLRLNFLPADPKAELVIRQPKEKGGK